MNSSLLSLLGFSVLFALLAYTHAAPTDLALRASSELAENGSTRVKRGGGGCGCGCCGCGGGGGGCGCCCCRPRCCCRCTCCKTCCCTRCCTCCRPCCCRPCCGCGCGCGGGGRKRRSLQKLAVKLAEKKRLEASSAIEAVAIPIVETAPEASTSPSVLVPEESKVQKRSPLRWSPLQAIADITLW